jgi:hypothetical protein
LIVGAFTTRSLLASEPQSKSVKVAVSPTLPGGASGPGWTVSECWTVELLKPSGTGTPSNEYLPSGPVVREPTPLSDTIAPSTGAPSDLYRTVPPCNTP